MDEAIKNANNACEEKHKEAEKQKTPNRRGLKCTVPVSGLVWSCGREVGIISKIESFSLVVSAHIAVPYFSGHELYPKSNNRDHQAGRHSSVTFLLYVVQFIEQHFLSFLKHLSTKQIVKDCPTSPYSTNEAALPNGKLDNAGVINFFANGAS